MRIIKTKIKSQSIKNIFNKNGLKNVVLIGFFL